MRGRERGPSARRPAAPSWDRARPLFLLVLVALLVAACSSSGASSHRRTASTASTAAPTTSTAPHTSSTTHPTPKPATNTSASAGCGHGVRAGTKTLRPMIAGRQRMAIVARPDRLPRHDADRAGAQSARQPVHRPPAGGVQRDERHLRRRHLHRRLPAGRHPRQFRLRVERAGRAALQRCRRSGQGPERRRVPRAVGDGTRTDLLREPPPCRRHRFLRRGENGESARL